MERGSKETRDFRVGVSTFRVSSFSVFTAWA